MTNMFVKSTPPKRDSNEAQLDPGRTSSSDVLVFNHFPLSDRIFSIVPLAMGVFGFCGAVHLAFSGDTPLPVKVYSLVLVGGALLFFLTGYLTMTKVEELLLDFSRQIYQLRTGNLWDVTETTGSLHDVRHIRLGIGHRCLPKGNSYDYMYAELVWRDNHPSGWTSGEGFNLKSVILGGFVKSRTSVKQELASYAAQLAARLHTSVIDQAG